MRPEQPRLKVLRSDYGTINLRLAVSGLQAELGESNLLRLDESLVSFTMTDGMLSAESTVILPTATSALASFDPKPWEMLDEALVPLNFQATKWWPMSNLLRRALSRLPLLPYTRFSLVVSSSELLFALCYLPCKCFRGPRKAQVPLVPDQARSHPATKPIRPSVAPRRPIGNTPRST